MKQEERENLLLVAGIPLDKAADILAKLGSKDREISELNNQITKLGNEATDYQMEIRRLKMQLGEIKDYSKPKL